MRHQKAGRKFGRKSAPRHAMFSNMVASLIEHERIRTTDAKAKELRRLAERTISWATSVGRIVGEDKKRDAEDNARIVHAMRMAGRVLKQKSVLLKLFHDVGPRMAGRPGGFTRIMKLGFRHGDAAPMSIIELVDRAEAAPVEAAPEAEEKAAKPAKKKAAPKAEAAGEQTAKPAKKKAAPKAEAKDEAAAPKKPRKKKTEE